MPFAWHREDSGYLAAVLGAAAIVAYLVFGNFGLVPSPFFNSDGPSVVATVDPVLVAAPAVDVEVARVAAPGPDDRPAPTAGGGRTVEPADDTSPTVSVSTPSGVRFAVTQPAVIEGVAEDAGSGVADVLVTFMRASGDKATFPADVTCADESRLRCTWSAEVPTLVAGYTVTAEVIDRDGNTGSSDPIEVTVVNTGGAVKSLTDTVQKVPEVLGQVVRAVLGLLD